MPFMKLRPRHIHGGLCAKGLFSFFGWGEPESRMVETMSKTAWRRGAIALALLACLVVAGCAQRERADEENRPGGFYGGVSVGR
jgi:hypothetical protein